MREVNDKRITHAFRALIRVCNIGLFCAVWILFYSNYIFSEHKTVGIVASLIIYFAIYNAICSTYKAFRFATTKTWELVFAQLVSFGIADLLLYIEACIAYHNYINLLPGIATVLFQLLVTSLFVTVAKKTLDNNATPKKAVFVIGNEAVTSQAERCISEINQNHSKILNIHEKCSENQMMRDLDRFLDAYDSVILYQTSLEGRRQIMKRCLEKNKEFYYTPRVSDYVLDGCSPRHLTDTPLMKYDFVYENSSNQFIKRAFDIVLSLIMLILTSPLMIGASIAIKAEDGGPVLFKQKRYTKDKKVFEIYKFRSMVPDADKYGVVPTTEKDPRITKTGAFIRATRIDELPQLINILKGDMSFVGPRPERVEHVDMYSKELPEFVYRLKVKQGLTGYAQVYGKYNTSPYDKLRLDLYYIENQSILLDLKLILLTIRTVFQPDSTKGFSVQNAQDVTEKTSNSSSEIQHQEVVQPAAIVGNRESGLIQITKGKDK